jgi:ribosomal protein S18 acetylase RimI-like enzyme
MNIRYENDRPIGVDEFAGLLRRTSLGVRRPVDDRRCLGAMLGHANLLCTAWEGERLVGVARSVTDFEFCCYVSDLAVDEAYQRRGIGRELLRQTQARLGARAKIILLAAPEAVDYYARIGFEPHRSAWVLPRDAALT